MTITEPVQQPQIEGSESPTGREQDKSNKPTVSRRGLLGAAGAGLAGVAAGAAGGFVLASQDDAVEAQPNPGARTYPFYGERQAGIITPMQDRLHFAAFDLTTGSRTELVELLQDWTTAAERMTRGLGAGNLGPTSGPYGAPPDDTGEALSLIHI